jgi:prepilin-type N-terminal cleavage/methylation domain-containing protein
MAREKFSSNNAATPASGFSLIEVLISMGLLTIVSLGVAQMFVLSNRTNLTARGLSSTTAMAEQKMEQLRALTWGFASDGTGLPVSDSTTNLAITPANQTGAGLNPSPSDSLFRNTTGFVDYLDEAGNWLGTGTVPPTGAVYIRRWSVTPLPTNPNNTLILQVVVAPLRNEGPQLGDNETRHRLPGEAWLVSVKTRKAQ